jgi:FkbM family methyltransferase
MNPASIEEYETLEPHSVVEKDGIKVTFATPNRQTAWRVETLFTKEPDTIEWISGFQTDEVLLDVGANVGMYSIWAAKTRGVKVVAFEPESQNYGILNKNIYLNGLDERITAYCLALSNETGFSKLYLSEFVAGSSCHNYGEAIGYNYQPLKSSFSQGCFSTTIDDLVNRKIIQAPDHIKIDVDGIEPKVIAGARQTLADEKVRSVLIEINSNLDDHWEIVDLMLDLGFNYSKDQVNKAIRTEGAFKGVGNYVFRR